MDLYRITRIDPRTPERPNVRYGTAQRVAAIRRTVRENNASRRDSQAWIAADPERQAQWESSTPVWFEPIELRVERAEVVSWADVSESYPTS